MQPQIPVTKRRLAAGRSIFALMLREMVTTYGRSPGGYLWAVLEPIAAISLLSFAFSIAFNQPPLGTSFPLFYATAYLPYMLFHDVSGKVATSIRFSKSLLGFAAVTWLDVIVARFLLNVMTHLMVFVVVIGGMLAFFESHAVLDLPRILNALAMAAVLALGVGSINAYLFLAFPAWERLWVVLTRPLFIISGVFFLFEDLPEWVQEFLWFNPVFHVTGEMRRGFYPTYAGDYVSSSFAYGTSIGLLALGVMLLSLNHDDLVHK